MSLRLLLARLASELRPGSDDRDWDAPETVIGARGEHQRRARQWRAWTRLRFPWRASRRPRGLWVGASTPNSGRCVLYFHGGGYILGSPGSHVRVAARLAQAAGGPCFAARYRRAPEHPYPAAVEDAVLAYAGLIDCGWQPRQIVVAGESAGGGLAVACVLSAVARTIPPPGVLVLFAPWVELESAPDRGSAATRPPRRLLQTWARLYLAGAPANDPLASPLEASLVRLPPTSIQAGDRDSLVGQSRRLYDKLDRAGVDAELRIWPGAFHGFHQLPFLPEARASFQVARRFIDHHVPARGAARASGPDLPNAD